MNRALAVFLGAVGAVFVGITVAKRGGTEADPHTAAAAADSAGRERVLRFWDRYREATALRTAGRVAEAAAAYAAALTLDREHEDALYYYGNMEFELGAFGEAEKAWRQLIAVNEASARAHSRLGELYMCLEHPEWFDLDAAEAQFRRAAELNREETGPLLHLGEAALLRGDLASAGERLDEVLRTNHESLEAHFLRGYVEWSTGRAADLGDRAERLATLGRDRGARQAGLKEGDTRSGTAMMAASARCPGPGELADEFERGSGPAGAMQLTALYRRVDSILAAARRAIP